MSETPGPTSRTRVLLLFGGRSAEHDVSRVTAVAVAGALDPQRYEVVPVAVTKDGRWLLAREARALLDDPGRELPEAFDIAGDPVTQVADPTAPGLMALGGDAVPIADVDVVVPLLHGPYGEDGTVQGLFELAGVPYVGSGVLGSAVAMDKITAKQLFESAGLETVRWVAFREGEDRAQLAALVDAELGYPCFVKPANMGSSVGVSRVAERSDLEPALDAALAFDEWVILEEAIDGREIEVAVLGDADPEASVPGEIVPADDFYTYADKYDNGAAELLVPAPLDDEHTEEVRELARQTFVACRSDGMARVDFFLEEGDDGRGFLVNEVNTIPGFTPISMYPRLWEASGVPYSELLDRLVDLARRRHERRARRAGRQRG